MMAAMTKDHDRASDERLLRAIQAFVAAHPHPDMQAFKAGIADWGADWQGVPKAHLPAAEHLVPALDATVPETRGLLALFAEERAWRKWEQSYTSADEAVSDALLAGYGFAEVIGKNGPFVSSRVRAGIGIWGPNVTYPIHRHQAEEVYLPLAGCGIFHLGDGAPAKKHAGDLVKVPSALPHGFETERSPLVIFYIWQGGDLREKSTFL
jgi:mannose-6-phosphate isomerase-like protein (cupin superfamily)